MGAILNALSKIPELVLKAANLADDMKKVQQNVEELQKQNLASAQINAKQEEQVKQLQEEIKKNSALCERILKLENEVSTLKALHQANNNAHMQEMKLAKHELKDHVNDQVKGVESTLILKFQTLERSLAEAFYKYTQDQAQPPQKFTPLQISTTPVPSDGNDGQGHV